MLFNSYVFVLLFLPLVLTVWWLPMMTTRWRLILLVLASYFFYGWWDYRFVSLLWLSTVADFYFGRRIHAAHQPAARRAWLGCSLALNLGLLGAFKYGGFLAQSVNALGVWLQLGGALPVPQLLLPIGISFYTFQTLSYSIDIYRGQARPADGFWHFAAYVSLFPQLIAGPIVRYGQMEQQLRRISPTVDWALFSRGLYMFVIGMSQKVLLADSIAARIEPLLVDASQLQLAASWYAMLGFSCQLYFDFAGYSNMAVGLGWMLGFVLPQNFDSPYQAANIAHFWRRWHISLSVWLRDYLFIPLGGSRGGTWLTCRNLGLVMVLGGLWHGAGWTFVIWGCYHGLLLAVHHAARDRLRLPHALAVAVTFFAVVMGWVLFRSTDLAMSWALYRAMWGGKGCELQAVEACGGLPAIALLAMLLAIIFWLPNAWQIRFRPNLATAIVLSGLLAVCVLRFDSESPFLYFQF